MKRNKLLSILICLFFLFSLIGCSASKNPTTVINSEIENQATGAIPSQFEEEIIIHYLDVGQADSIFIELPNNETMLIDAGDAKSKKTILNYIKALGYNNIDYVVATHPHADHIGSMNNVLKTFSINHIYMPKKTHNTKMFETMLNTIKNNNIPCTFASLGTTIVEKYDLIIEVLSPISATYTNLNNYSLVVKIDYGESEFLFTGDAETLVEQELLTNNIDVDSDVLKVGHHGSSTSSSKEFIEAVSPSIAVISCGRDNKYGFPHKETLQTLKDNKVTIYRTDQLGTIIIKADKYENFSVFSSK